MNTPNEAGPNTGYQDWPSWHAAACGFLRAFLTMAGGKAKKRLFETLTFLDLFRCWSLNFKLSKNHELVKCLMDHMPSDHLGNVRESCIPTEGIISRTRSSYVQKQYD